MGDIQNNRGNIRDYQKGLYEVADGVFAYLQPDGGWGWSNAGLVSNAESSLLVDTLFDLRLTQEMLDAMSSVTDAKPISTLVNTHANGDHCHGNQLVSGAQVIASEASAREMADFPASTLHAMMSTDFGETTNEYIKESFGPFDFSNIEPGRVDRTFSGELSLHEGGRSIELIEVGPAHTAGDVLIHLPEERVIFTGDILFIHGTPIVWDGPVSNWIAACDRILSLGCDVIVPGHGPLTSDDGVRAVRDYLNFVVEQATMRFTAGMTAIDAARDIELGAYTDWTDWERIAINVDTVYGELDPSYVSAGVIGLFNQMGNLKYGRS